MMNSSKILEARIMPRKTEAVNAYQEMQGIIFLVILLLMDPECQHFLSKYLSMIQVFLGAN